MKNIKKSALFIVSILLVLQIAIWIPRYQPATTISNFGIWVFGSWNMPQPTWQTTNPSFFGVWIFGSARPIQPTWQTTNSPISGTIIIGNLPQPTWQTSSRTFSLPDFNIALKNRVTSDP